MMNSLQKNSTFSKKSIFENQNKNTLEKRKLDSTNIMKKYPGRIPIICEIVGNNDMKLDKKKYLVPGDININQFTYIMRKKIKIDKSSSIYIFTENDKLPLVVNTIYEIYNTYKNEDGFLYLKISEENTFG